MGPVKFRCMLINGESIKVEKVKLLKSAIVRQKLKLHLELSQVRQFIALPGGVTSVPDN